MKLFATITVIGRDQTGVVARVTGLLFEQKANIEGLEEKVTRGQFGMTIQASPISVSNLLQKRHAATWRMSNNEIELRVHVLTQKTVCNFDENW